MRGCKENSKPPTAIAGPDQIITLPTDSISLEGRSSSDPDGTISEWLWTKISGPASFNVIKPSDSTTLVKILENVKFDIYDIATNTWAIGVLAQNHIGYSSIIAVNNVIYVAGGVINGNANAVTNQVCKLEF